MLTFPQLSTGALVQYPLRKRVIQRTILNRSADGRYVTLSDAASGRIQWDLTFEALSDAEAGSLVSFFEQCEGPLNSFTFFDPTENLLAYSEDLSQPVWQRNSLLNISPGVDDPMGTSGAWRISNTSSGDLALVQTASVPGSTACAFSLYMRGTGAVPVLSRTDGSTISVLNVPTNNTWNRYVLSTVFASSVSSTCDFSLLIPKGFAVDVFGFQLDAQPGAGTYVKSTSGSGVYTSCRFASSQISLTCTAPGQNKMTMSILSSGNP